MTLIRRFQLFLASAFVALASASICSASGSIMINGVSCPSNPNQLGYASVSWSVTSGEPDMVQVGIRPYPNAIVLWQALRSGTDTFSYIQQGIEYDFWVGVGASSYTTWNPSYTVASTWVICQ